MKRVGLVLTVALTIMACGQSDIEAVKGGTMNEHETTTIGQAFEGSFTGCQWKEFQTEKGQRVVEFNGKVGQGLHDSMATYIKENHSIEEIFQLAMLRQYQFPDELDNLKGLPKAIDGFLDTLWVPGTDFKTQWVVLTGDSGGIQINHMGLDGEKITADQYDLILNLVFG